MQNYVQNGQVQYTKNLNNQASQLYVPPLQPAYNPSPQPAPACSAVNIQIFNPAVNPATGSVYPTQTTSAYDAGTNGGCYPSSYYTTQPGGYVYGQQPYTQPVNHYPAAQQPVINQPVAPGFYDADGRYYPYVQDQHGNLGYIDENGQFHKVNGSGTQSEQQDAVNQRNQQTSQTGADSDKSVNSGNNAQTAAKSEGTSSKSSEDAQTGMDNSSQSVKESEPASDDNNSQQQSVNDKDEKSSSVNSENSAEKDNDDTDSSQNAKTAEESKSSDNVNSDDEKGFYDKDGKYHDYAQGPNGEKGYIDENGKFVPLSSDTESKDNINSQNDNNSNSTDSSSSKESEKSTEKITEKSPEQTETDGQKTKKIKVVALSNDYIKTLENYLDSQDIEIRKMGAHEIVDRLNEDPSRKDDPALTALVNKMLQDPSSAIRAVALSIVESRMLEGDNLTVKILKKMQKSNDGFGLDATQATSALLKMAGKTVEKEVPLTENEIENKSKETK